MFVLEYGPIEKNWTAEVKFPPYLLTLCLPYSLFSDRSSVASLLGDSVPKVEFPPLKRSPLKSPSTPVKCPPLSQPQQPLPTL